MAKMSNYLQDKLLNHVFRNTPYIQATNLYVALYESDPTDADIGTELTGNGYAREIITFDAPSTGTGTSQNTLDVTFPASTANWNTITHIGIRDGITGGNLITFQALSASVDVLDTNNFRIPVGQLTVIMS